ncbi:MAG: HDOD domain-containing protein [Gammaproteobacteria bacterium]
MDKPRLPCLDRTRNELKRLADLDTLSAKQLGHLAATDTALAVALIHQVGTVRHRHLANPVTTLRQAAQMLGVNGMIREAEQLPSLEQTLPPEQQAHYRRLLAQSALAGRLGLRIAYEQHDLEPGEVALAALLNNLGHLALWVSDAPQMESLTELETAGGAPIQEAEFVVFGQGIEQTARRLAAQWSLPELVAQSMEPQGAAKPRIVGVMLAARLAQQALHAWRLPGLGDDLSVAADYLQLERPALEQFIDEVVRQFDDDIERYGIDPVPAQAEQSVEAQEPVNPPFCLAPRSDLLHATKIRLAKGEFADRQAVTRTLVTGLHRGLGLNRVVFAIYAGGDEATLTASVMAGTDYEPRFNRFRLALDGPHLFTRLMQKPQAYWMQGAEHYKPWKLVPMRVRDLIHTDQFFAASLFTEGQPYGLVYADRRHPFCRMDELSFAQFKPLCAYATQALERLTA